MNARWLSAAVAVAAAGGLLLTARSQTRAPAAGTDEASIRQSAQAFADAFNRGDPKAVAALWTENGESRDADGRSYVGRAAIEAAYTAAFKATPGVNVEVLISSIRFPAKDMAVEEGLLRFSRGPKDLPATSSYVAVHAREGGQWKIALSSEAGVGVERVEDLDWLLGEWTAKVKEDGVTFKFARDPGKSAVTGTVARTTSGKESVVGTIRITADPETGQIRSWFFEDDGAHSQGLWSCDGKSWLVDVRGVLADGTPTAERIVLQRVDADVLTWRAIDRVVGDTPVTDTPPIRLTRATGKR
jgi:uncharacterized protein (TIGR02246 family)